MRIAALLALCAVISGVLPSHAAEAPSIKIKAGRYTVTVAPSFNGEMGKELEEKLKGVPSLSSIKADSKDSSLHFTVKENEQVKVSDIARVVKNAANGAVISTPVLDGSLDSNPGL